MGWTLHAHGAVEPLTSAPIEDDRPESLETLWNHLEEQTVEAFYEAVTAVGIHHGASFQGLAALWIGEAEAVGEIQTLTVLETGGLAVHPAVLDACLQVTAGAAANGRQSAEAYVPFQLERLELLAVLDYANSEAVQKAHIFLPTTTLYETGGVYINQEARLQAAQPAHKGGISIAQVGGGDHPPRIYGTGIPGNEPVAAWQLLASLIDGERQPTAKDLKAGIWSWLAKTVSVFKEMAAIEKIPDDGIRIYREKDGSARFSIQRHKGGSDADDHLELIAVEWIFGTEELSSYSECLTDLEGSPGICMCRTDAQKLNLSAGDRVSIELGGGALEANLQIKDNMAAGMLVIPRHKNLEWQKMDTGPTWVRPDQIRKLKD